MRSLFLSMLFLAAFSVNAQSYTDSMRMYRHDYITKHEVVKAENRSNLQFFEVSPQYRVEANFEKVDNSPWFKMKTSGKIEKLYRIYGTVSFNIDGSQQKLNIYQSQDLLSSPEYSTYLFLPFTDATSGSESYLSGRYIDLKMSDIKNGKLSIDFNKAYNPYCAYVDGIYNCPIPPKENNLAVAIRAGEKNYIR